jgi:hypothetical protein
MVKKTSRVHCPFDVGKLLDTTGLEIVPYRKNQNIFS